MKKRNILLTLLAIGLMLVACDTKTKNVDSCGDGFLDPGEECDGSQMTATTCGELGYYDQQGIMTCKADCSFDLSVCTGGRCGDSILQPDREDCEVDNLGGETCISLGYERGTLACDANCSFDRSDCEGAGECGDGEIQTSEECDGNQLGGQTCAGLGYYAGTLTCRGDCQFDFGSCQHRCGDGVVDADYQEACDGMNLAGATCVSLGYQRGILACNGTCGFDLDGCEIAGSCGDGVLQANYEDCEGADLNGQNCETVGFGSGPLACTETCGFDTVGCSMNYVSTNIGTLIYVPAGTFQRGTTVTNLATVSAFRMSKYEIHRAKWTVVTGWVDPSDTGVSGGNGDPVQTVSWYDAIAFCNKLRKEA